MRNSSLSMSFRCFQISDVSLMDKLYNTYYVFPVDKAKQAERMVQVLVKPSPSKRVPGTIAFCKGLKKFHFTLDKSSRIHVIRLRLQVMQKHNFFGDKIVHGSITSPTSAKGTGVTQQKNARKMNAVGLSFPSFFFDSVPAGLANHYLTGLLQLLRLITRWLL